MKEILSWINRAVSAKSIAAMDHYCVQGGEIRATDGRLGAGYPWPTLEEYLIPAEEFEKIVKRMPDTPQLRLLEDGWLLISSGRFRGKVQTLPVGHWYYEGIADAQWQPFPGQLLQILRALRPFISDNAVQQWAMSIALQDGWAYATNNVAIAGARCPGLEGSHALLPVWAIDFVLDRAEGLTHWAVADSYYAFKWKNGSWMKASVVVGQFPEKAAGMVRDSVAEKPTQEITPEFRGAFERIAEMAGDVVDIYADRIESSFGKAVIEDGLLSEVPEGEERSRWGTAFLLPALQAATSWSPGQWPKPVPWKGPLLSGYVVGRRA